MRRILRHAAVAVAFLLLAGVSARAQEKSDRLSAMDIFNLQYAADPQISPDGARIVYVRNFADVQSDKNYSNLWIINFDGSDDRALTTGNFSDTSPRWSPDGTRLAYLSDRDGKTQIYVRWMDTGQTAKLTNLENAPQNIAWSPDGKQLSFASLVAGMPLKIATLPAAPEGAKWADPPKAYDRLVYRFNGPGYLKPGFTQLFIVSADGGAPRQLTSGNFPFGGLFSADTPSWTPDGKFLIFSSNLRPDFEYQPLNNEVYEVSLADGAVRPLTNRLGPDDAPAVSPDGKAITYVGFDDRFQGHQTTRLYLMNRDGSGSHVVTTQLDRDVTQPRWAADGSGIYFVYDDQGDTKLAFSTLDGKVKILAEHLGSGGSSYSGGAAYSVAHNGAMAFTHGTPSDPGDIAAAASGDAAPRVITALNKQLFTQKKLGTVEEIWFNLVSI